MTEVAKAMVRKRSPGLFAGVFISCFSHAFGQSSTYDTLSIYFPYNSELVSNGQIKRLHDFLVKNSTVTIESIRIDAYADTVASSLYNLNLSLKRSRTVKELVSKLLPSLPQKMIAQGLGEIHISPFDSLNRKADIIIAYKRQQKTEMKKNDTLAGIHQNVVDTVIEIDRIYFMADSPVLSASSQVYLPQFIRTLLRYKENRMEIKGYVNQAGPPLSKDDPLFRLSEQRARVIYEYFIEQGFHREKLSHMGMGNAEMVNPHPATLDEKKMNMRVELVIYRK